LHNPFIILFQSMAKNELPISFRTAEPCAAKKCIPSSIPALVEKLSLW
jgi:hypothetical protein